MLAIASKDVTVMSIKPTKYEENYVLFYLIHLMPVLPSYRNQSVDLL